MRMKDFLLDDTNAASDMSVTCDTAHNASNDKCLDQGSKKEMQQEKSNRPFEVDEHLLKFKAFFFLFFAGFGATFPYLGVYFKQIGLNASFVGVLAGIRPLIQFISGPFWALVADKYKARKIILLFSILAWLVMTLLLAFPRPHREFCRIDNSSYRLSKESNNNEKRVQPQRSVIPGGFQGRFGFTRYIPHCLNCNPKSKFSIIEKRKGRYLKNSSEMILSLEYEEKNAPLWKRGKPVHEPNKEKYPHEKYIIERDEREIRKLFYIFLVLIVVGEFLEAPSFIMIDTALLDYLGEQKKHYGKTRLFGSIGYGVASFSVGALLDKFQYQFCGKTMTNYLVIFYIFSGFMVVAFVFGLCFVQFKYIDTKEESKPIDCLKVFLSIKYGSFLSICWFCGFCHGAIMNFLNWFLEDLGASKLMMGVATTCRCAAIICGFFTSSYFIDRIGHISLICWALASYVGSFFGYSLLINPWWAIPVEVAQGLIYAISWSSCITYLGDAAPPNTGATMQGILQGVYWGLGTGTGTIIGGVLINHVGVRTSFRLGGALGSVIFVLFCLLQCWIARRDSQNTEKESAS